jgi:1-acyl-sn-glycerol-3-phosphate acyltransferase
MGQRVSRHNVFIRLSRLARIVFHTWLTALRITRVKDPYKEPGKTQVRGYQTTWSKQMLNILGITLKVHGKPLRNEPCLYVSNHQGFIDVPVIMDIVYAAFIAKAEVRKWPIFGRASAAGGSVFVERSNADSRRNVSQVIGKTISDLKRSIIIFPEGTSSSHGKEWKKGSFVVAAERGFPVQPIRIAYNPHRDCCYINDDKFIPKIWDLLGHDHIDADVEFLEPVFVKDAERDSGLCQQLIQDSLIKKLKEWNLRLETYDE